MIVTDTDIRLGARHTAERFTGQVTEIRAPVTPPGNDGPRPAADLRGAGEFVEMSSQALELAAAALQAGPATTLEEAEAAGVEPRMLMLAQIIAHFFGRDVVIFVMQPPDTQAGDPIPDSGLAAVPEMQNQPSLRQTTLQAEFESTRFEARGAVRTADGRQIEIDVELNLSRSFIEWTQLDLAGVERRLEDPLVINLDTASAGLDATRFRFDLDASGRKDSLPTLNAASGYLVKDRNGNGVIDDGSELFGALSGDGFADLRVYDGDGNGWIDRADPVFEQLQVWIGAGSQHEELKSLEQLGIGAIYLGSVNTPLTLGDAANEQLGQLRSTGVFLYEDGQVGTVQQIDLAV